MYKEQDWFPIKSDTEGKLDLIKCAQEVDRSVRDELEEVIVNALRECNLKYDVFIDADV